MFELHANWIEFIFKINYKVIPKGKYLNENEQPQITALLTNQVKISAIATTIGRPRCVVRNFIDKGDFYGNKKKTKGNTELSAHDRRYILWIWTYLYHQGQYVNIYPHQII